MSIYTAFGTGTELKIPDRGIRRRGFAKNVEVPVEDLDAYTNVLFQAPDPRASLFSERTWTEFGASLAAAGGAFRLYAPVDEDQGGCDYLYITGAGAVHRNSIISGSATVLATGLSGATSFSRRPGCHLAIVSSKARHSTDLGVTFSADWTQIGTQNPVAIWVDETGAVLIVRENASLSNLYKYSSLANASTNTSVDTSVGATNVSQLRVFSKIGADLYLASNSGDARYFKMSGISQPMFPLVFTIATGSFVGGFEYKGGLWWKETTGAKTILRSAVNSFKQIDQPFAWTTHQAFFSCGAYLFDLSDDILRYSLDGETWEIHSVSRATQDLQAAGRRLFYSTDNTTYVHKFTGLL